MTEERKQTLKKVGILLLALLLVIGSVITMFAINSNKDPEPTEPSINIELPDDNKPTEPDITEPTVPDETVPDDTVPTEPTVPDETKPTEPEPTDPEPTEPEKPKKTVVCIPYLTNTTLTYNGKEQGPTVEKHYKHVEITSDSELTGKNVDTYTVTFKLKDKETMTWTDGTTRDIMCDWKIVQKEVELEWGRLTWPYDGKTHSTTCEITNLCGNDVCTVVLEGNAIKNVGKKDVVAVSLSNKNYKLPVDITRTLVITDSSLGNIASKDATCTYDGEQHSIEDVSCSVSGVKILYSIDDKVYTNVKPSFTEAGTYKIYWSISKEGYKTANGYNTLTIQAKEVELSWGQLKWVYDGKAHSTTCIASNLIGNDVCNITLEGNSITNVGTQPVKAISVSNKNYKLPEKVEQILEIKAAKLGAVISDDVSFVYDGDNHTINDIQCETENVVIKYSTSNNGNYTTTKPEYKNAGSYTIYWVIEKTGYETKSGSNKLVIEQKEAELKWGQLEWQYDGDEHSTTCSVSNLVEGDACEVVLNGNSIKNVGTQPVKAVELSNKNYKLPTDCERVLKITLNKLGNVISDDAEYTYDGKGHSIEDVQCTTPDTTILYSNSENGNYTAEKPHYVDAGVYKIYWSISKTGYETVMGVNTLTINKAAIAYAKPVNHTYDKTPHFGLDCNGVTFSDNATATNAGKYTVSVKPTKNYLWVDGTDEIKEVTYEIFPIELIVNWGQHEWIYDGQEHSTECVISGVLDDDICEVILENNKIGPDVGSEIVKITEITNSNYIVPEEELEYTLKITPAYLPLSTVGGIVTYNGMSRSDRVDVGINIPCNITWAVDTSADFDYNNKTFIAEKPELINVGRYNIHCKVEPLSDNYRTSYATIEFEILPKEVRLEWGQLSWQYDGKEHFTTCAVANLCGNDVCDVILENNIVGPKAGTAIVKAVGLTNSNYKLPNDVERTLEIVGLKDFGNIVSSDATFEYDEKEHSIPNVECETEDAIILYSSTENGNYTAEKPHYVDAGTYKIYWTVSKLGYNTISGYNTLTITKLPIARVVSYDQTYNGEELSGIHLVYADVVRGDAAGVYVDNYTVVVKPADNYAWEDGTDGEKTIEWSILQREIFLNWGSVWWEYDGEKHYTTCEAGNLCGDDICEIALENNEIGPNIGKETVKAVSLSNKNYKLPENTTKEIEITPTGYPYVTETGSSQYNGQSHAYKIKITPSLEDYKIVWSLEKDGEYTEERPEMIDVGNYTVYFKILPASPNYREYISSIEYAITPRLVELEWGQLDWTYDGSTHSTTCVVSNLINDDICDVILENNIVGPEVGETVVKAVSLSNPNYKLPEDYEKTLSITDNNFILVITPLYIVPYDGQTHSIEDVSISSANQGYDETAVVTYSDVIDGEYGAKPEYIDVGEYITYYKIEQEGHKTSKGKAILIIEPRTADLQWGQLEWEYDGETHSTTCIISNLCGDDVCDVVLENNSVGPEIGQQTVKATSLSNKNYKLPTDVERVLEIKEATVKLSNILLPGNSFRQTIKSGTTTIIFTNDNVPTNVSTIDVSAAQDKGVLAWFDGKTMYIASATGGTVYANPDCRNMFGKTTDYDDIPKSTITSIVFDNFDTSKTTDMSYMFDGMIELEELDISGFDTSNVTNMAGMFCNCRYIKEFNLGNFDTSNVTNMSYMFARCANFTKLDMNSFNTNKVTDMSYMFDQCWWIEELDVSMLDTSNVTTMKSMFHYCRELDEIDLTTFDTSNVTDMSHMFEQCLHTKRIILNSFDTTNVTDMSCMFHQCCDLISLDLSSFDTSSLTKAGFMLQTGAIYHVSGISNHYSRLTSVYVSDKWDVSHLSGIAFANWEPKSLHNYCGVYRLTGQYGDMVGSNNLRGSTLHYNKGGHLTYYDGETNMLVAGRNFLSLIPAGTTEIYFGDYHNNIPEDKSSWIDFSIALDYGIVGWLDGSKLYVTTQDGSEIKACASMHQMFTSYANASSISQNTQNLTKIVLNNIDTTDTVNMREMFDGCNYVTELDVSGLDFDNVENMYRMFAFCKAVEEIDLCGKPTPKLTNMSQMFWGCEKMKKVNLDSFNTSQVTDMRYLFEDCASLTELDLTSFDVSSLTNCSYMFSGCTSLTTIYATDWSEVITPTECGGVFSNCKSLKGAIAYKSNTWDYANTKTGYFTIKPTE